MATQNDDQVCPYIEAVEFLSPVSGGDRALTYTRILKKAVREHGVYNIALAGPYGSGKSSILADFKDNCPDDYIEVSLASFRLNSENASVGDGDKTDSLQTEIEKSILQQLFFSVSKRKIPHSRMKRINHPLPGQAVIYSLIIMTLIISGYILLHPDLYKTYPILSRMTGWLVGALIVTLFIVLYQMANQLSRVKLSKLVIQNTEFDLAGESKETSLINKHIDELVYFFSRNKYGVVIIEDLDRFGDIGIFEKLRELNTLINRASSVSQKVVFIYAVKDDFLVGESRTKFFDLIIPVIPFINASGNARHLFIDKMNKLGIENTVSTDLVKFVSHYVHDYRLLVNIFNEFLIYMCQTSRPSRTDILNDRDSSQEGLLPQNNSEMFALIFYKNMFPEDFSALHRAEGVLYSLLHHFRMELAKRKLSHIEEKLNKAKEKIDTLQNMMSENLAQQRLLCLQEIFTDYKDLIHLRWGSQSYTLFQIADDRELFQGFLNAIDEKRNMILQTNSRSSHSWNGKGFETSGCRKKLLLLEEGRRKKIADLEEEIGRLKYEKIHIFGKSLAELFQTEGDSQTILKDIQSNIGRQYKGLNSDQADKMAKILWFLLREGFIDDSYPVYISYFHEYGVLTAEEMSYINNVIAQRENDFSTRIIHPEAVLDEIPSPLLSTPSALNHDLVCFVFSGGARSSQSEYKSIFLRLLKNNGESIEEFLTTFVEHNSAKECASILITMLAEDNDGFWENILDMNISNRDLILALLLKGASKETLDRQGDALKKSFFQFERLPEFIRSHNLDTEKLQNIVKTWNGEFARLVDFRGTEPERRFLQAVCDNNAYKITFEMVSLIMKYLGGIDQKAPEQSGGAVDYGAIVKNGPESLLSKIDENMNEYVRHVYIPHVLGSGIYDYHSPLEILNHDNIDDELIELVAEKMEIAIPNISEINNCMAAEALVSHAKILPSWENVLQYFIGCAEMSVDEALSRLFSNENFLQKLLDVAITDSLMEENDEIFHQLIEEILFSGSCSDWCLDAIKEAFGPIEKIVSDLEAVDPGRLDLLLQKNLFAPEPNIFITLREYSLQRDIAIHIQFLSKNMELLRENIDELTLSAEDVRDLLESEAFSCRQKLDILEEITDVKLWGEASCCLKSIIRECLDRRELTGISEGITERLFEYADIDENLKMRLLATCIGTLESKESILNVLEKAGAPYALLVEDDGATTEHIGITEENRQILNYLATKGIIGKFRENRDMTHFIVYKKRI